jgi:phage/plasmid-like protein (TIGR03299 family)
MAINVERGHPWHRLGTQVHKDMSMENALALSGSDDEVMPVTLMGVNPETGEMDIPIESHVGIWSNKYGNISVASPSYEIMQRAEILELAYQIEGLDSDAAHVDSIGNLGEHAERFFAYIRVPDLVIDPNGIADIVERGLFVATSFDGTLPNVIGESAIRVVCQNTLKFAMGRASRLIKVRHTVNAEERIKVAAQAHGYIGAVAEAMSEKAMAMLAVEDGDKALTYAMDWLWPVDDKDLPDSTKTRRMNERGDVRTMYEGKDNLNIDKVGRNGYAAYNAIVEYLDHARPVRGGNGRTLLKRSEAAALPGPVVDKKAKVSELVLASVN